MWAANRLPLLHFLQPWADRKEPQNCVLELGSVMVKCNIRQILLVCDSRPVLVDGTFGIDPVPSGVS